MREHSRDQGRLEDILKYAQNVEKIMDGISYDDFTKDIRIYYSVMKNVEVVGEAAYMLTKAFKKAHPATPWKFVQGMRHVLVHDYATIDDRELYNTAVNDIPVLKEQVERYLAETDWEEWASLPDEFDDANKEDIVKAARSMKDDGMPVEQIAKYTGLTAEEIEGL